jgi:hypothetical protein
MKDAFLFKNIKSDFFLVSVLSSSHRVFIKYYKNIIFQVFISFNITLWKWNSFLAFFGGYLVFTFYCIILLSVLLILLATMSFWVIYFLLQLTSSSSSILAVSALNLWSILCLERGGKCSYCQVLQMSALCVYCFCESLSYWHHSVWRLNWSVFGRIRTSFLIENATIPNLLLNYSSNEDILL